MYKYQQKKPRGDYGVETMATIKAWLLFGTLVGLLLVGIVLLASVDQTVIWWWLGITLAVVGGVPLVVCIAFTCLILYIVRDWGEWPDCA